MSALQVLCHLETVLADRDVSLAELSRRTGISTVNLAVLKNQRAKAIRFSTLLAICSALHCQPADLFSCTPVDD